MLQSIPGIGAVTAADLIAELPEPGSCDNQRLQQRNQFRFMFWGCNRRRNKTKSGRFNHRLAFAKANSPEPLAFGPPGHGHLITILQKYTAFAIWQGDRISAAAAQFHHAALLGVPGA
ncbi:MAG: hypothetical protein ACK5NN_08155 [Sphingomonadaceae bacterium]